jgi:hypothetical protein
VKPCFTDVYRERGEAVGVAEFETMEEMRTAIRRLDDTEFKNPFEKSYIRIVEVSTSIAQRIWCWMCWTLPAYPQQLAFISQYQVTWQLPHIP